MVKLTGSVGAGHIARPIDEHGPDSAKSGDNASSAKLSDRLAGILSDPSFRPPPASALFSQDCRSPSDTQSLLTQGAKIEPLGVGSGSQSSSAATKPRHNPNFGIADTHLAIAKKLCQKKNCSMMFRPTTKISVDLIERGFATKSMDIKGKTSWLGLIVCDQAFSKKLIGDPEKGLQKPPSYEDAHATQLTLSQDMLSFYEAEQCLTPIPQDSSPQDSSDTLYFRPAGSIAPKGVILCAEKNSQGEYDLSWKADDATQENSAEAGGPETTPLWVWGYQNSDESITPVTGDYDQFACNPSLERVLDDSLQEVVRDSHGSSVSSRFNEEWKNDFNSETGRAEKPVVWHGAEMQNIHFAQPLDESIVVVTPGGDAATLSKENLPKAMQDLVTRGYAIKLNPSYFRDDLPISGQPFGFLSATEDPQLVSELKTKVVELRELHQQKFNLTIALENGGDSMDMIEFLNKSNDVQELDRQLIEKKEDMLSTIAKKESDPQKQQALFSAMNNILMFTFEITARLEALSQDGANLELKMLKETDFPEENTPIKTPEARKAFVKFIMESVHAEILDAETSVDADGAKAQSTTRLNALVDTLEKTTK